MSKVSDDKKNEDVTASFPVVNFSTFINSLAASALVHLGIIDDPISGTNTKNLAIAKQTIDILAMIEIKTKNNLSEEERNLLMHILHDLKLNYAKSTK